MCGSATLAIVVSSACMMVASITDTVMKPRLTASGVVAALAELTPSRCSEREAQQPPAMAGVDFDQRAQAGTQFRHARRRVEPDAHRYPLCDLHPVAGGILRR